MLKALVSAGRAIAPAGEWLLDNFHLIEEQVRTAKRHLPKAYSRELPRLLHGPSAGLPRIYDIALEAIAHGDGRLDAESLRRFVAAYQAVAPLKLGELWAIPIMLRFALLENLRRVAARIAAGTAERDLACAWADRMIEIAGRDAKSLILATADMARSNLADGELLRRRACASLAGPGRSRAAAHLDGAAARGAGSDHRAPGAVADPGAGRRPGLDGEQHRQPAAARGNRLA